MASIVPSYEYDIFISYRQKDNRSDQWVTKFVQALKEELDATFKEDISIYFDENPHDGLEETHDVDDSLAKKLKCLIFIPIVSQTYCDPNAFAWQNELKVFIEQASNDQFGLKTRLSRGNIASRVLPMKIHNLDTADEKLFESEVGGVMRSIDFIYKETGVNRPLRNNEEFPEENLNHTLYRNQVNKVANAIKDLILGIKGGASTKNEIEGNQSTSTTDNPLVETQPKSKSKVLLASIGVILVIALAYLFYNQNKSDVPIEEINMSIAVLPFEDMSPDRNQEYFSDGLAEEIINVLMQIPNIQVVGRTSSFSFRGSDTDAQTIGKTLNATHLIQGSVRKFGNQVKVQVYLIDVKTGFNLKSYSFPETQLQNIFELQDNIAQSITSDLKLSLFSTLGNQIATSHTESSAALEEFFKGRKLWSERRNLLQAISHFEKAIALDPNYDRAYSALAETYVVLPSYTNKISTDIIVSKASEAIENSLQLNPNNAEALTAKGRFEYKFKLNWAESEKAFKKAITLNPNYGPAHLWYGIYFHETGQLDKAPKFYLKTVELEPRWAVSYYVFGLYYLNMNDVTNAKKLFKLSREIQPDYVNNSLAEFNLAVFINDFQGALKYWEEHIKIRCEQFTCKEQDLITVSEILRFLVNKGNNIIPDLKNKIQSLSLPRDRVTFAALLDEREILFSELNKLKEEDRYNFSYVLRYFFLDKVRNDPEFRSILRSVGLK